MEEKIRCNFKNEQNSTCCLSFLVFLKGAFKSVLYLLVVTVVFVPFLKDVVIVLKETCNVFLKVHSVKECGIPLGVCFQGVFCFVFGYILLMW